MRHEDFRSLSNLFLADVGDMLEAKGADYSVDADRLSNFKQVAEAAGVSPLKVWLVYFMKHVNALQALARGQELRSEGARGRFVDVAAYAALGLALWGESNDRSSGAKGSPDRASDFELGGHSELLG